MDELNSSSSSPSRSSRRHPPFASGLVPHQSHLERIRRTLRARNYESLDARRRRLMSEESGTGGSSATGSVGKRRKIEQHHGQVEMAQLELELAYCDGGKHKESNTRPQSVLQQNEDVYCTRGSQCSMIFQHVDGKCFTLKKMVIQGPSTGYTSPVQEGIIFVTMDKNDLVAGCKYPFRFEHNEDEDDDEEEDPDENELEESDDDVDLNELEFPLLEPCDYTPASSSSHTGFNSNFFQTGVTQQSTQTDQPPLEPSARFKIQRDDHGNKMKATLTFEPALSGRYILARFFSPSRNDNIDIQFIGAYGYVGRRFFPDYKFR